jgi:hypothetical protein
MDNFKALKKLYDLRSAGAHAGMVDTSEASVAEKAVKLCAGIFKRLIDEGEFSDWDSRYVIGG